MAGFLLLGGCNDNDTGALCEGTEDASVSRIFLQKLSDTSVTLKWRGNADVACLGTAGDALSIRVEAVTTEADHREATVANLEPDTRYFYSIGGAATAPAEQSFKTAPTTGSSPADDGNVRIWIVGDSGTAGYQDKNDPDGDYQHYQEQATAVMQGMQTWINKNDQQPVDLFLMLGDNAYNVGGDVNYQEAVFDVYTDLLKSAAVIPTIGNHEMGSANFFGSYAGGVSISSDPNTWTAEDADDSTPKQRMPYLDIFSLPTNAESGGVASGTEQYYSLDYGNVHVVSLDSQLSARDPAQLATMKAWLQNDLDANNSDWTIVIFHHP
ncbi:MAG: metallophosphoesterase family protein, partial [Thiolinea sp.]